MKDWLKEFPWENLTPLIYLLVASGLVFVCPDDKKGELIFLIAGAALTRVRIGSTK